MKSKSLKQGDYISLKHFKQWLNFILVVLYRYNPHLLMSYMIINGFLNNHLTVKAVDLSAHIARTTI